MKKILYILTSLILLLPNLSFGQQQYTNCSEFIQDGQIVNTTFIVGDSSYYNVEADENLQDLVLAGFRQLSLQRPTGGQLSLGNWTGSGRVLLTQNGIFSNIGSAQYIIRSYQNACKTNIITLNVTVMNPTLTFCSQPAITTTQNTYPIGNNLSLAVEQLYNQDEEGVTDSRNLLYYNFIYPNGDTTSLTEWQGSENNFLPVKNNLTLADSGQYYIRFRQSGCATSTDSINISLTPGLTVPFYEGFEKMINNYTYPNWTFKGPHNDSAYSKSNWYSLNQVKKNLIYNALVHYADSAITTPDTITSSTFLIRDTVEQNYGRKLHLAFDISHLLRDSTSNSYDTLIVKTYVGNNLTPIQIYKKGGLELRTSEKLDTTNGFFLPNWQKTSLWRTEQIDLSNFDTASTIKFLFILKPSSYDLFTTPSNNFLLDEINITYINTYQDLNLGLITVTADTLYNRDRTHTVTVNIPSNHNGLAALLYSKSPSGLRQVKGIPLTRNDTATTFSYTNYDTPNMRLKYYASLKDSSYIVERFSDEITVTTNCVPPIGTPRFTVDSTRNKDRKYKLILFLPPNHNSDIIKFYDGDSLIKVTQRVDTLIPNKYKKILDNGDTIDIIKPFEYRNTPELFNDSNIYVRHTTDGFKIVEYTRYNVPAGLHRHSAVIGSTDFGKFEYYDSDSLRLVGTDTLNVIVDTITTVISNPSILVDKNTTSDGNYNITLSLPTRHNAMMYELLENGKTLTSELILSNDRFSKTIPIQKKPSGTYTYTAKILNTTTNINTSSFTVTSTYVPPIIVDAKACTTNSLTAPIRTRNNFTYRFTLNPNCPTTSYKALFYSGQNVTGVSATNANLTQAQINRLIWKPELGSARNAGFPNGNIKFTNAELTSKVFNRVVTPLLSLGNRWYKVEIICTTCSQTNKKKTAYFYVTN